jgi:hypothetical protein
MDDESSTMKVLARVPIVVAGCLAVVACSSSNSHPPALDDCISDAAPCSPPVVVGGSVSENDDGSSGCMVNPMDSLCAQCANASCCAQLGACYASADCQNLMNCELNCGNNACTNGCQQQFPHSVTSLDALTLCVTIKCSVCNQSGVGDPCVAQAGACNPGLSCGGLWCTRTCAGASDCTGLGPNGGNELGRENECVRSAANGDMCFAGCMTDSDCAAFPGTYCLSTTSADGLSIMICASSPDGGMD